MSEVITADLVDLDLSATTKDEAARALAERMAGAGRVTDLEGFLADVAAREAQMPTGLDGGIGIPHCRSEHVAEPTLAFGRPRTPIDFGAADGPADLIFLIAAPAGADSDHLTMLSALARELVNTDFTDALRATDDPAHAAALIRGDRDEDGDEREGEDRPAPEGEEGSQDGRSQGGDERDGDDEPTTTSAPGATDEPATPDTTRTTGGAAQVNSPAEPADSTPRPAATTEDDTRAAAPSAAGPEPAAEPVAPFRVVAVTSCPTGIAHTYMAAESLENAAAEGGYEIHVETQGSAGFERLDPDLIARADGVVFAHDVEVREKERFGGKPTVDVGVKAAINRPTELLDEVRQKAARGEPTAPAAASENEAGADSDHFATRLRTWLMTGVSYMVPFVAAGGLLIALAFAIGGYEITDAKSVADHFAWLEADSWAALFHQIGSTAFDFLVPVLAGYIAYGMADRPGLVPGFVGGALALSIEAGFLGGLAAGLLAGTVVRLIQRVRIPAALRGIMPVVVIPLISSAVVGFLMFVVIGKPIAGAQSALTDWLGSLDGNNAILLGALLGLMMCTDLGGPVNKVAYAFAAGGIAVANPSDGALNVMAAVMAAGMVPPLAMALATTVRARLFSRTERENGKAAWVLGASFITEGAIPFAAADPLRVIPSAMAGGAVTGALSMAFGATLRAPHGGVFVVPLIGSPLLYLVAIAAGTAVTTTLVLLLKGARRTSAAGSAAPAGAVEHAEARTTA
ncbi:fructose-specific PTS transporter subunit EIIC [Streptomyces sp. XM4193]|uniref:fructose-specific PTS transporter subunit EIIC n=1 Tax=Streptomyces sp. XM4193 TaxID=2929782 RepID=UPI001FFB443B|nr:fructose-specific PTS transporter subunit EIIC [Streptomyces sp. XM4193]MCK1796787.1 fructose-specific PTS transporter subunit EIIC [Streptomyces sp. XM4193]